ncbi:hypothetical protein FOL47_003913 [Perkinsus chesapeaki]|uniref:P-type ATPase A domain-containing protein n=1 Tax=Perkinsus chesapeaki TaxID=330153 RepID=A0A7J6M5C0_PERCH|nr:hypothetical protein FOL47_003913 [Perkinsus chesapeaki]
METFTVHLDAMPRCYKRFVDVNSVRNVTATLSKGSSSIYLNGRKLPLHRHGHAMWFRIGNAVYMYVPEEESFRRGMFHQPVPEELASPDPQARATLKAAYAGTALNSALPSSSWLWFRRAFWAYFISSPVVWFQLVAVSFWLLDHYYDYALTILVLTILARGLHLRLLYRTYREMKAAADESVEGVVLRVKQRGVFEEVPVTALVPGDVVKLETAGSIPADCVLVCGSATVEHSFISGESEVYKLLPAARGSHPGPESLLLCGGRLLDASGDATFLVLATGHQTLQGLHLEATIAHEWGAAEFRLRQAILACVLLLAAAGMVAFTLSWLSLEHAPMHYRIMSSLDVLTDALPPALPVALLVLHLSCSSALRLPPGVLAAQRGSLPPLVLAGLVDQVVLDKTNTITTGDATVVGVGYGNPLTVLREPSRAAGSPQGGALRRAVTVFHQSELGRRGTDTVDEALLEFVGEMASDDFPAYPTRPDEARETTVFDYSDGLALVSNKDSFATSSCFSINGDIPTYIDVAYPAPVIAHAPFDPTTRLAGVLCGSPHGPTALYVRGAPEALCAASNSATIPSNFYQVVNMYTNSGFRVIAYGGRENRNVPEADWLIPGNLRFIGIVVIHMTVHPLSNKVVTELSGANIKCSLCTGDADGTARASASVIGLLQANSTLTDPLVKDDRVQTRMTPWSKACYVRSCNAEGRTVMMCGDGTNDIPALSSAAVGLVLSSASHSPRWNTAKALQYLAGGCLVGVDTSKGPWLCCEVLAQGRGAFAAAVIIMRLAMTYAILQVSCVSLLYYFEDNLTDSQYAKLDLLYSLPSLLLTALFLRPSFQTSISEMHQPSPFIVEACLMLMQLLLGIGLQVLLILLVNSETWSVEPHHPHFGTECRSYENWALYESLCCIYLSAAISLTLRDVTKYSSLKPLPPAFILALVYAVIFLYKLIHISLAAEHRLPSPLPFRLALYCGIHIVVTVVIECLGIALYERFRSSFYK